MKRTMRTGAVLALALIAATACTRRVQVESEPSQPNYIQTSAVPAAVEVVGQYDYVVEMSSGDITGPMTVTRLADGGYAVTFLMQDGQEVPTSNVRRRGAEMSMDVETPGGMGSVNIEWTSANVVEGEVFLGETLPFRATRRS